MSFLVLQGVRKQFGTTVAVAQFDLEIARGEFVSFLGPSGCGKTTTLRMVAGFEQLTAGKIILDGVDISVIPPNKRNIGMVFQSYALFPNMTVADNIGFGLMVAGRPKAEIHARVGEMLDLIAMSEYTARYPYQLSGGQQQRVALARALALQPQVLLLDEPLSALDAQIRDNLRQEIREIQRRLGITTIYVTHDQQEAMALSDRIVVMSHGRVAQVGAPHEIYNTPRTRFVASFVGTLNILSATVVDAHRVRLGESVWQVAEAITQPIGSSVECAVRPELLRAATPDVPNQLTGVVQDVVFLGATVRVTLVVAGQRVLVDLFNDATHAIPQINTTMTVACDPRTVLVLAE
jgi:putative spermidine/putrescine transport system ATP-binding protein